MFKSIKKNKKGILFMIISSICACVGQLFWKLATSYGLGIMFLGFLFYGIGAIVMIIAYRYGKLSVLQPILSINYVLSTVLGAMVLKENISILKTIGVLIIISGVILITGGDEN